MKFLLLTITTLLFLFPVFAQTKKPPVKQRDSIWYERKTDTIFGTVQFDIPPGKIMGEGILVTYEMWKWVKRVPELPPQYIIHGKDTLCMYSSGGALGQIIQKHSVCYLVTNSGYKKVQEQFIFTPLTLLK